MAAALGAGIFSPAGSLTGGLKDLVFLSEEEKNSQKHYSKTLGPVPPLGGGEPEASQAPGDKQEARQVGAQVKGVLEPFWKTPAPEPPKN
jgi:hypothetical protein